MLQQPESAADVALPRETGPRRWVVRRQVDLGKLLVLGGVVGALVAWWLRSIWREDLDSFTRGGQ